MTRTHRYHFGTSSWSEKSWLGPFYPKGTKPADYLTYYATQFDTVECDATYYRVPTRDLVRGWERKTPDGFVLSAKFPRSIVHGGESQKPDGTKVLKASVVKEDTKRFLDAMGELGKKCGPLVLQFPYFNRTAFESLDEFSERLEPFLEKLPKDFRYGVEIRNKNWLVPELTKVLKRHKAALVLVDLVYMPHPSDLEIDLVTSDFTYVRLIGDRKAVEAKTETFDKVVIDQGARLKRWAKLIRDFTPGVREVYAYANNHYAGYAPETIREIARMVGA
jgi:uncharacterized protein YecE (DUF72 family)